MDINWEVFNSNLVIFLTFVADLGPHIGLWACLNKSVTPIERALSVVAMLNRISVNKSWVGVSLSLTFILTFCLEWRSWWWTIIDLGFTQQHTGVRVRRTQATEECSKLSNHYILVWHHIATESVMDVALDKTCLPCVCLPQKNHFDVYSTSCHQNSWSS